MVTRSREVMYRVFWPEQAMSRGGCLIPSIVFEEKKGDHWGHTMEVQWNVLP